MGTVKGGGGCTVAWLIVVTGNESLGVAAAGATLVGGKEEGREGRRTKGCWGGGMHEQGMIVQTADIGKGGMRKKGGTGETCYPYVIPD